MATRTKAPVADISKPAAALPAKAAAKPAIKSVAKPKVPAKALAKVPAKPAPAKPKAASPKAGKVAGPAVDQAQRANYIEVAAYYIAQRRGFTPGDAGQDYLNAAAEVDQLIAAGHFAK
jgi:Protein of unknown function (DUF2934)